MFRRLEQNGATTPTETRGPEAIAGLPRSGLTWLDLDTPTPEDLEVLRQAYGFHPLALEDCAHLDQRPKVEEFGDHTFLVMQTFGCQTEKVRELVMYELHAFLGGNYLVTVHDGPVPAVDHVWERARADHSVLSRGVDYIYYLVADSMVDTGFPIIDRVSDELEDIESRVLDDPRRDDFARVLEIKRTLVAMRKVLSPQRDMVSMLARRGDPRVSERTALYFRDVYDHLVRLTETIEANRDLLSNSLDAYLSSVSNRTNEVMKHLTVLSAVFLPLSFIVGFFGQNFAALFGVLGWENSRTLNLVMSLSCLAVPAVMLLWFKRKGWLD